MIIINQQDAATWNQKFVNEHESDCADRLSLYLDSARNALQEEDYEQAANDFCLIVRGLKLLDNIDPEYYNGPLYANAFAAGQIFLFGLQKKPEAEEYLALACRTAMESVDYDYPNAGTAGKDYTVMKELFDALDSGRNMEYLKTVYGKKFPTSIIGGQAADTTEDASPENALDDFESKDPDRQTEPETVEGDTHAPAAGKKLLSPKLWRRILIGAAALVLITVAVLVFTGMPGTRSDTVGVSAGNQALTAQTQAQVQTEEPAATQEPEITEEPVETPGTEPAQSTGETEYLYIVRAEGGLNLRKDHSAEAEVIGGLENGAYVTVKETVDNWAHVAYCSGYFEGWCSADYLEKAGPLGELKYTDEQCLVLYEDILNQYRTAIVNRTDAGELMESQVNYMIALQYEHSPLSRIGYAFRDVDQDGTPELFIGCISDEGKNVLYAMYTQVDGTTTQVFSAMERSSFSLLTDGTIYNVGSSSAFETGFFRYGFNGKSIIFLRGMVYNSDWGPENPWFQVSDDTYDPETAEPTDETTFNTFTSSMESSIRNVELTPLG